MADKDKKKTPGKSKKRQSTKKQKKKEKETKERKIKKNSVKGKYIELSKKKGKKFSVAAKNLSKRVSNWKSKIKKTKKKSVSQEKKDVWRKNIILAGIVAFLVLGNLLVYYLRNHQNIPKKNVKPVQQVAEVNNNNNSQLTPEEEEADRKIQEMVKQQEMESWKIYENKAYGFTIKYPQNWPEPSFSGPQKDFKFRYKLSFREKVGAPEEQVNGFDIYIYRNMQPSNKFIKADYTDNITVKETAAPDYSNCKELEVFSLGKAEYPALQVYTKSDDPCFREAYFFSLKKNYYIFDFVPVLKSGINYEGYDGEKKVEEEFPDFYRILSTLDFPIVKKVVSPTTTKPVTPKVEAPRVVRGIRCPEKIQHPSKSNTKGKHVDEDCCPDPDEWPKAGCAYSAHDYSIMLKGKPK